MNSVKAKMLVWWGMAVVTLILMYLLKTPTLGPYVIGFVIMAKLEKIDETNN